MPRASATLIELQDKGQFRLSSGYCTVDFQVSLEDRLFVIGHTWRLTNKYVVCSDKILLDQCLHVLIAKRAGLDIQSQVDHKDRDKMNCRRDNLRPATGSQNQGNTNRRKDNTSGYKGVTARPSGRWQAQGFVHKKVVHLGTFDTAKEANEAYTEWAKSTFGEFANSGV